MMKDHALDRSDAVGGDVVRYLYPLMIAEGLTQSGREADGNNIAVVVDVETTGLDPDNDHMIELALRRFRHTDDGIITQIDKAYSWLEDPGCRLSPEISQLTKLTDDMLTGQSIDTATATRLLRSSSLVIAHHARFDRGWVERRLPESAGLNWACSMEQIDWPGLGFDGRKLGHLLNQIDFYHAGHRATADVDAVIQLLRHRTNAGKSTFGMMLEKVSQPSWIIWARGASFEVRHSLRLRGYRWDANRKCWWREVDDDARMREEFWLASNVYAAEFRPKAMEPEYESLSAKTRFL